MDWYKQINAVPGNQRIKGRGYYQAAKRGYGAILGKPYGVFQRGQD